MIRVSSSRAWSFGDFLLDEAERRLTRCGVPVRLTPKGFDLLVALVERGGRLLRKHESLSVCSGGCASRPGTSTPSAPA